MSFRNRLLLPAALSMLAVLAGCGGSSGTANPVAPPSGGFSNSNLNGTYVFSISGTDVNGTPYAMVGTFTANGSGGITGGTLDINDLSTAPIPNSPISKGSYNVGVDGRGIATLQTTTPFGSIIVDFVLQNGSHGLVTEFDSNASGSGTLDAQTAGVTPTGSYAFSFSGLYGNSSTATVGNFAIGSGGATGLEDFNSGGIPYPNESLTGSVVLGPSATPATQLAAGGFTIIYDVYAIDAAHLKFIEMDANGTISGDAFSQTSTAIPSGTLAFTLVGGVTAPVAAGGFMVTDGAGNITTASTEDVNNAGSVSPMPISFSAQYAAAGTGRLTLTNFSGFFGGTGYAAYPSSGGLLLLEVDGSGGMMVGAAYAQTAGATFAASQGYGLNLSGSNLSAGAGALVEVDDIAEFSAVSSGTTVTGVTDENFAPGGAPNSSLKLSGTYGPPDSNGRGQIAANAGNTTNGTLNGGFGITFYTLDGTTFPFIESDSGQVAAGVFVLQTASASSSAALAKSHMFMVQPLVRPRAARQKQKQK
jgi:hypothetical protein